MSKFIEISPNVSMETVTTVEITLGRWGYRSKHLVEVHGSVVGFSAIRAAIDDLEENIERRISKLKGFQWQQGCIDLYIGDDSLEIALDDDLDFEDLVVSAVIVKQEN